MGASDHTFSYECTVASRPDLTRASTSLLAPSFRDGPKDQTSDAQLRIGEPRDSPMRNCALGFELVLGFLGRQRHDPVA
jgi:hypothetical protein